MNNVSDNALEQCLTQEDVIINQVLDIAKCENASDIKTLDGLDDVSEINTVDLSGYSGIDTSNISRIEVISSTPNYFLYGLLFVLLIVIIWYGLRSFSKIKEIDNYTKEL